MVKIWLLSPTNVLQKGLAALAIILFALAVSTGLAFAQHLDAPDSSDASESAPSASQSLYTEPHDLTPSESEASIGDLPSEPSASEPSVSEPSVSEPSVSEPSVSEASVSESSESESSESEASSSDSSD